MVCAMKYDQDFLRSRNIYSMQYLLHSKLQQTKPRYTLAILNYDSHWITFNAI